MCNLEMNGLNQGWKIALKKPRFFNKRKNPKSPNFRFDYFCAILYRSYSMSYFNRDLWVLL